MSVAGAAITFENTVTATSNGGASITNSGQLTMSSMTLDGAFSQQGGGNVSASGTITTTGDAITFTNAVTLTGALSLDTTSGAATGANIHFASTIDGGSDLTLNAGTAGTIALDNAIGGGTRLGNLTFTNSAGVTAGSSITSASLTQSAGSGTADFKGTINTTTATGVSISGAAISFESTVTTTGSGGVSVTNTGLLTMAAMTLGGAFSQQGGGNVSAAGSVTTSGDAITFTNAVTLTAALSLNTTSGAATGANISFASTINGGFDLTLNAGTAGTIALGGAVGGSTRLGKLTFSNSGGATASGNILAASVTQTADAGTTDFKGTINTNTSAGVNITGAAVTFEQTVTTTGNGIASITNSGLLTMATMTLAGAFSQQGGGTVSASGTIATSGDAITFTDAVTLVGALSLNTTSGAAAGANIHFISTIDGGFGLTLNAGSGGTIGLDGDIGDATRIGSLIFSNSDGVTAGGNIQAASVTQTTGAGTTDFQGTLNTNTAAGVNITGAAITFEQTVITTSGGVATIANTGLLTFASMTLDGAFTQTGGGTVSASGLLSTTGNSITFTNAVTLTGDLSLDTTVSAATGGHIHFTSTIDGGFALTLNAGTGNSIALDAALGSGTRLGDITVTNSNGLTAAGNIAAASLTQSAGSGTADFKGTINTNTATGVSITGAAITFEKTVTATSSGGASITNSGTLTMTSMTLDGAFSQQGGGNVSLAGTVTTSGDAITFTNAVTLSRRRNSRNTTSGSPAGANIHFLSTLDGGQNLTLNAGTGGTIALDGAVGGGTRLGTLTFSNSAGVTAGGNIRAAAITQTTGSGTTDFKGTINTNTSAGVNITGAAVTFEQTVTTTSNGVTTITNSGLLTMTSMTLAGAFSQLGSGGVSAGGTLTTSGDAITFTGPVTLTAGLALNTINGAATGANIHFVSTIDGTFALSLNAGTRGTIALDSAIGAGIALGTLTFVNSAGATVAGSIQADSLTQSAGTGTTDFQSTVSTSGSSGISITGAAVDFEQLVNTAANGGVSITNSGLLTMGSMNLDGAFIQQGGGSVSAAGNLTTSNDTITFTNAVTLTGSLSLATTSNASSGANIALHSTIGASGVDDLTLTAGSAGTVTLSGAVGASVNNFTVTSGNGVTLSARDNCRESGHHIRRHGPAQRQRRQRRNANL